MKHRCAICDYSSSTKANLKRHYGTAKHKKNLDLYKSAKLCEECGILFKHSSNYYRHIKTSPSCQDKLTSPSDMIPDFEFEPELTFEHKSEPQNNQKIVANVINIINSNINSNNINNINSNNTLAKIEQLNNLFSNHNMIDMDTFIKNYSTNPNYQLTEQESHDVLENYLGAGHKSFGYKLSHYLKDKCRLQLKDITSLDIKHENTVIPLLSSDRSTRIHYERQINSWKLVTDISNIKKLIVITSDQVYQHHNKYINLTSSEMKVVANTILKDNQYQQAITNSQKYHTKQLKEN